MLQHHGFTPSPLCESNSPEHSASAKEWWDRSTLIPDFQGFHDWFSQSKFKKKLNPNTIYLIFQYHCDSHRKADGFCFLLESGAPYTIIQVLKSAELLCWNFKEKSATWGRKKSQNIPVQIIHIAGIYYWLQTGVCKALCKGDSPQPSTPRCPGAGTGLLQLPTAPPASWLSALAFWWESKF